MALDNKTEFSAEDFQNALSALDEEIAKSKNLRAVAPVKLLSAGGFVAVTLFQNRLSTQDIDYIMDPNTNNGAKIKDKLQRAINSVARKHALSEEWINSRMEIFAVGETRQHLFRASIEQNVILWHGTHLIIYAAQWEWSLARKLKRIGSQRREVDVSDALEILAIVVRERGQPLTWEHVKSWDAIVYTPLDDTAIAWVASAYYKRWGTHGIVQGT
ncbi:hypothetical protein E4U52_006540 [Claviceps spartinae]|nr:hypothetical protein E4U52_006540 [Claviceps spartinae]